MKLFLLLLLYPVLSFSQSQSPEINPRLQLEFKGETIGFDDTFIFKKSENGTWYKYMEVELRIMNASVYQEKLIIGEVLTRKHYIVDLVNRTTMPFIFPEKLFEKKRITSLVIEKGGSSRYFGEDEVRILYLNDNGKLQEMAAARAGQNPFGAMGSSVKEKLLQEIVMEADRGRDNPITMADLGISRRDIRDFRLMISQKQAGTISDEEDSLFEDYYPPDENKQYDFYLNIAENLDTISSRTISRTFGENNRFVSHMTYNRLEIGFEDSTKMTIISCNHRPGFFHTPLLIDYEGLLFNSTSVKLGRLIDKLTKGTFLEHYSTDGKYAILQIADYLYQLSLERK